MQRWPGASRLPPHQRYPLRSPLLHRIHYRRARHLHLHAIALRYQVQPIRCCLEGIPASWQGRRRQQVHQRKARFLESQANRDHRLARGQEKEVLISRLEYEIIDWKLRVKIGGLGVMPSFMDKSMTDVDMIWVVPKVKDLEYLPGEPIEVIVLGETYLFEVEKHVLDKIAYVILDSPVFRAQTKFDPCPARMNDLPLAIFYSTWNQAMAMTAKYNPDIDMYHINDCHGALYPLPKVIPACLSLHNAEFRLWPLRTKEEMKEVCSAFNITKEHCKMRPVRKHIQLAPRGHFLYFGTPLWRGPTGSLRARSKTLQTRLWIGDEARLPCGRTAGIPQTQGFCPSSRSRRS